MGSLTITEALARVKTIDGRISRAMQRFNGNLARPSNVADAISIDGGSPGLCERTKQSIMDLIAHRRALRVAIMQSNIGTDLTVGKRTMSVYNWLVWKRENADVELRLLDALFNGITTERQNFAHWLDGERRNRDQSNATARANGEPVDESELPTLVESLNILEIDAERDEIRTTLDELDGKLSLHNATTFIDIEDPAGW